MRLSRRGRMGIGFPHRRPRRQQRLIQIVEETANEQMVPAIAKLGEFSLDSLAA